MSALQAQAVDLQNIQCLGEEILASCHPDSVITLKSWISVTKTRYEEVTVVSAPSSFFFLYLETTDFFLLETKPQRCLTLMQLLTLCGQPWEHLNVALVILSLFSNSGSDLGSAARPEDPDKLSCHWGGERGGSEASRLDLISRGVPEP